MNHHPQHFEQYSQENASQLVSGSFNPQVTVGLSFQNTLTFELFSYQGHAYQWSATQYQEQPDFVLNTPRGNIWVQIEIGLMDLQYHQSFLCNRREYPITKHTAQKIVAALVQGDLINEYFTKNVKLRFSREGKLMKV